MWKTILAISTVNKLLTLEALCPLKLPNAVLDPYFEEFGGMFRVTLFGPLSSRKPRNYGLILARQEKAIDYLKTHKSITAPQYAKLAGISHPTGITDLNALVAQGVLLKIGSYSSSKYVLEKD